MNDKKNQIRKEEEETVMRDCPLCDGTGLFSTACWDSDSIPCDECMGSGEVEEEVTDE